MRVGQHMFHSCYQCGYPLGGGFAPVSVLHIDRYHANLVSGEPLRRDAAVSWSAVVIRRFGCSGLQVLLPQGLAV